MSALVITIGKMVFTKFAKVTDKHTHHVYDIYRVNASNGKDSYEVAVSRGVALNCTCKSRKYSHKGCKHIVELSKYFLAAKKAAAEAEKQAEAAKEVVTVKIGNREFIGKPEVAVAQAIQAIQKVKKASKVPTCQRGALNGNRGFSLMRV